MGNYWSREKEERKFVGGQFLWWSLKVREERGGGGKLGRLFLSKVKKRNALRLVHKLL